LRSIQPDEQRTHQQLLGSASAAATSDEYGVRLDHNVTDNVRIFARWSHKNESKVEMADYYVAIRRTGSSNPTTAWMAPRCHLGDQSDDGFQRQCRLQSLVRRQCNGRLPV